MFLFFRKINLTFIVSKIPTSEQFVLVYEQTTCSLYFQKVFDIFYRKTHIKLDLYILLNYV